MKAGGPSYFYSVTALLGEDVSDTCYPYGCYDCDVKEHTRTLDELGTVCVAEGSGDSGILG